MLPDESEIRIESGPRATRLLLHCTPSAANDVAARLGIALGTAMLTATTFGRWTSLHLAPDEWLLVGSDGAFNPRRATPDEPPLSLVDVTDRFLSVDVLGRKAADVLAVVSPLDFALKTFPVGGCTRGPLGKADMTVWRLEESHFHVLVGRSFYPYAHAMLQRAAVDCGLQ
jgi:sarcosine oxidase subunit gamma